MKYIRTKDGIYDTSTMSVSSLYDNGVFVKNVSYCKRIDDFTLLNIYENDIIKQADTIEELCDVLVIDWKDNAWNTTWNLNYHHKFSAKEIVNTYDLVKKRIKNVYGAIWCEWGLKYVAKMNDKGDLELL